MFFDVTRVQIAMISAVQVMSASCDLVFIATGALIPVCFSHCTARPARLA